MSPTKVIESSVGDMKMLSSISLKSKPPIVMSVMPMSSVNSADAGRRVE